MTTSEAGLALIEQFEGLRLTAYRDGAGVVTIGYGHTGLSGGPSRVKEGDTCTVAQAEEWLKYDVAQAESAVNTLVRAPLTQNQFDALVSFTYNLGWAAFESSLLLRLINSGNSALASAEFVKWDHVAGAVSAGLLRRRTAEQTLFRS